MNVTIKKIAIDLNLAVSTVSKALQDSHEISVETKQRVFDYATKVNYIRNPYASSLKKRRTGNIAVVLPEVADSFFSIAINGIESVAQQKGYHVMIYLTHEDSRKEAVILKDFRSGRVDGVLLSVSGEAGTNTDVYEACSNEMPVVFFDRVCKNTNAAKILTDDFQSGYRATEHLILKGCTKIGFLAMKGNLDIIEDRLNGFKRAHLDYDQQFRDDHIIYCTQNEFKNHLLIHELLNHSDRPDGLVGSVEKITTQAYMACYQLNLSIPKDIKIVSFSSTQIASIFNPSLTTITQPAFEMGKAAANLLFKALDKKIDVRSESIIIPSALCERDSTK